MTTAFERIPAHLDVQVNVLNADAGLLHRKAFKEVVSKIINGKMWLVESYDPPRYARSATEQFEIPRTVMVRDYVYRKYNPREFPRREDIFRRDGHLCQFVGCGNRGETLDHVFPKSRGGQDTWHNLVAACHECNGFKADRTPEEAGMRLIREPFRPRWS